MKKICVIGLGYVGLPLAVEFGKSRSVIGFDNNPKRIKELNQGIDLTKECSKENLLNSSHLKFSCHENDLKDAEIYIVTVPTPIDASNNPDLAMLKNASETVGRFLSEGNIVIYESTVFPGATEEICIPILQQVSGLTFNKNFYCGYSPERINPGDKVNTLPRVKKITSGSTPEVALEINDLYLSIVDAGTYQASSIKVAEAAKVIENAQRDLNIAFVNELSMVFDKLDLDTVEVLTAAESKWNFLPFRPGMVGGHCIGVDPYYLTYKAEEVGYNPQVILSGRRINDNMAHYAALSIIKRMIANKIDVSRSKIAVLGITFKENCPDIRNSKVADLVNELQSWNAKVLVCDPWANKRDVKSEYGIKLVDLDQLKSLDAIIVSVGHNEFRAMLPINLRRLCKGKYPVFGDLKSIYDKELLLKSGFTVFRL